MNHDSEFPAKEYERIRTTAYHLAGGLNDLPRRASVYYQLYKDSGGRCVFPLIAAHAALWGHGHFTRGMLAGKVLALPYLLQPSIWRRRLAELNAFADAFRDINRRICAETYCAYTFTSQYGETAFAQGLLPHPLLDLLNKCHHAKRVGVPFDAAEREQLFRAFVRWEQEATVTPAVDAAFVALNWPALKWFAMRPKVDFAYFKHGLQASRFVEQDERVAIGMQALRLAETVGYPEVEKSLESYKIMPQQFLADPVGHFSGLYKRLALQEPT